jgi:hypothetical protein
MLRAANKLRTAVQLAGRSGHSTTYSLSSWRLAECAIAKETRSKGVVEMKMNAAQIEQTLQQFQADAIPAGHPVLSQLERLFGDHTYFLDDKGLNIVEPVDEEKDGGRQAVVVNLADWNDRSAKGTLEPHPPEATDQVIALDADLPH